MSKLFRKCGTGTLTAPLHPKKLDASRANQREGKLYQATRLSEECQKLTSAGVFGKERNDSPSKPASTAVSIFPNWKQAMNGARNVRHSSLLIALEREVLASIAFMRKMKHGTNATEMRYVKKCANVMRQILMVLVTKIRNGLCGDMGPLSNGMRKLLKNKAEAVRFVEKQPSKATTSISQWTMIIDAVRGRKGLVTDAAVDYFVLAVIWLLSVLRPSLDGSRVLLPIYRGMR